MPQSFIDTSSSIMQSYLRGRQVREQRERRLQQDKIASERLKLQEQQQKLEQKRFEDQLKATQDFRDAQLENQKAMLDFRKAVEAANKKQLESRYKLDWLTKYSEGKTAAQQEPNPFIDEGGQIVDAPLEEFEIAPGITVNRSELPEQFGAEKKAEAAAARLEQSLQARRDLENQQAANERMLVDKNWEKRFELSRQENRADLERALAVIGARNKDKNKGTLNPAFLEQLKNGNITLTSTQLEKYAPELENYTWPDGSKGLVPIPPALQKELREASASTAAIEFSFKYAQAIEDWLTGSNTEYYTKKGTTAFREVVRLRRDVQKHVPGLRQGSALGVLSKSDLELLQSNLPDIPGDIYDNVLQQRILKSKLGGTNGWGMQRAIDLAERYKKNVDTLLGIKSTGQRDFEFKRFKLAPKLDPRHARLFAPQPEDKDQLRSYGTVGVR